MAAVAAWMLLLLSLVHPAAGVTEVCLIVPQTVDDCYATALHHQPNETAGKIACLEKLLWHYEPTSDLSLEDRAYFEGMLGGRDPRTPPTGFRVRKEYRRLTETERIKLHRAFNVLYRNKTLERFGRLHAFVETTVNAGPAFPPWNRLMLVHLEEALRSVDPTVSLPYWDSTLDSDMDCAVNSVLWSTRLLGNGYGEIVTGPFRGWHGRRGPIQRNIAAHARGRLINKKDIRELLRECRLSDITMPTTARDEDATMRELQHNLEHLNNLVHNWVGGDMQNVQYAAYDPIFYMHHAFIDLLWEMFRIRQIGECDVNPANDYPPTNVTGRAADDWMAGFPFQNKDGLQDYWTTNWYSYESQPNCGDRIGCGYPYLFCNQTGNICVSHSRRTDWNAGKFRESSNATRVGMVSEAFEPRTVFVPKNWGPGYQPAIPTMGCNQATARDYAKSAVEGEYVRRSFLRMRWPGSTQAGTLNPRSPGIRQTQQWFRRHLQA